MPDVPDQKAHPHPIRRSPSQRRVRRRERSASGFGTSTPYAELTVTSNFSFLRGASYPDELVQRAAQLGYRAVSVTDRNSLAGIVCAHVAAKDAGIPLLVGCRLVFTEPDWLSVLVYPTDRAAYGRLCRLLTLGKRRAPKGECHLTLTDLQEHQQGMLGVILLSREIPADVSSELRLLCDAFDDDRLSLAMARLFGPDDQEYLRRLDTITHPSKLPTVAVNDVHYHHPDRRVLQDVLTCVRHGCTVSEAGFRLFPNGERYLKPPDEMARLFADRPDALARTIEIAERARGFNLDQLRYEYPDETCPPGLRARRRRPETRAWIEAQNRVTSGWLGAIPARERIRARLTALWNYEKRAVPWHEGGRWNQPE